MSALYFRHASPEGYAAASMEDKQDALRMIIYGYTAVTALAGVFVWFVLTRLLHPGKREASLARTVL